MIKPYYETEAGIIYNGDSLDILNSLESESVQCCITSPPYWGLRQYLPSKVSLKKDTPEWVVKELEKLNIFPVDNIGD